MSKPEYQHIVDDVTEQIDTGRLKPGQRLPTYDQLAELYVVSRTTVRSAMMILAERGLVVGKPGKGTYVSGQAETSDH